ncbi:MAG TPA: hypothetical protein VIF37_10505 [Methylobacter sp.]|jgi:hypothetical protein
MQQAGIENDLTPLADCSSCNYRDTLLAAGTCKPADYTQDRFWERRVLAYRVPLKWLLELRDDTDRKAS